MHGLTIVCGRDMPKARALARQFLRHHPDGRFSILLADPADDTSDLPASARLLHPPALGMDDEELGVLGAIHGPAALPCALLPRLLAFTAEPSVYLDSTMVVHGPLVELEEALRGSEIVVVPTLLAPLPDDGARPSYGEVLERIGVIDRSVLGWRPGRAGNALLEQWPAAVADADPALHGPMVFQRWLDSISALMPGIHVLRHPGYALAYWNIDTRPVAQRDDEVMAEGAPLRLLNLRGFDPDRPDLIATGQTRVRLSDSPIVARLVAGQARELRDAGWSNHDGSPPWSTLPDGAGVTFPMRMLYRNGRKDGQLSLSPFTPAGKDAFYAWLNQPAERGAAAGLTRYLYALWANDPQLQGAYPQLDGPDGVEFAGWAWVFGRDAIPLALLPPKPDFVRQEEEAEARRRAQRPPWGVNVAGFFRSELGLGEAARLVITGLDAANVPALPVQGALIPPARQGAEFTFAGPPDAPFPINLICMNGDTIPLFAQEAGPQFFEGRHSIALWWWELGQFPDSWRPAFDYLDEVWVASDQIYGAIAPNSPVPVVKIPLPVVVPRIMPYARRDLGFPEDDFVFLYMYDYHSTAARKNPVGHVEAFKRAFPEPESGTTLILKCINASNLPEHHEQVLLAAGDRADIQILDRYVSAREKDAMIAACDCYLSLHRSEGFGLTPAEAMYLGKPVIATAYGGTLEFMTTENSYLVDYTTTRVGERAHPYPADAEWADPDLDQAARYMGHVFEHQDEARERGRRAAADIRCRNSPEAAGAAMERRLTAIYDPLSQTSKVTTELGHDTNLDALRSQIESVPVEDARSRRAALLRKVRGVAQRLLRFQFAHQRRVNHKLLDWLEQSRRDLQLSHVATLAGFRRVDRDVSDTHRGLATLEAKQQASAALAHEVERHLAEHRALPYMAPESSFVSWREDGIGIVLGFTHSQPATDDRYRAFTDAFRGPEERVRELQHPYLDLLAGHAPVLDAGCGRGELLDALADAGIEALGVDTDAGMVEHCKRKGHHSVEVADVNDFLQARDDGSLGAIFSAQVVEHLPYEHLVRFLDLAVHKLRPAGVFVAETVNPHALPAFKAFWVDPTHQHPLFPEVSLELCRIAGFATGYVFHPGASGDVTVDRSREAAYAIVARVPSSP